MFFFLSSIFFSPEDLELISQGGVNELELVLFLYEWPFVPIQEQLQPVITGSGSLVDRFLRSTREEGLSTCYIENCPFCPT